MPFFKACLFVLNIIFASSSFSAPHTVSYTYDELGRLTFVNDTVNRDYDYDNAGNRVSVEVGTSVDFLSPPSISPSGGAYVGSATVTLIPPAASVGIRYTTDGTDVTSGSPVYSVPITLTSSATVKAKSFLTGQMSSQVAAAFTVTPPPVVATPSITNSSVYPNNPSSPLLVSIRTTTPGATIRYTSDNTPVTERSPLAYDFTITSSTTVRARAFKDGWVPSGENSLYLQIQAPPGPPSISPVSSTYVGSVTVSLNTGVVGATVRYTTDNTAVTSGSPAFTQDLLLTSSAIVRAKTFDRHGLSSPEISRSYTIAPYPLVATPTSNPAGGTFYGSVSVRLEVAASDAIIRYTTNGSDVTENSPQYLAPFTLTTHSTVKARAFKPQMSGSIQRVSEFTVHPVATPTGLSQSKGSPYHYNISWNAVAGATSYEVRLSNSNTLYITNAVPNAVGRITITNELAAVWVRACASLCGVRANF
jgi:hypothetical protein